MPAGFLHAIRRPIRFYNVAIALPSSSPTACFPAPNSYFGSFWLAAFGSAPPSWLDEDTMASLEFTGKIERCPICDSVLDFLQRSVLGDWLLVLY